MKKTTRTEIVLIIANYYLDIFKLKDWEVIINKRLRTTLGQCDFSRKKIEISQNHIEYDSLTIIILTLLHELAHAKSGEMGHGKKFQREYNRLLELF